MHASQGGIGSIYLANDNRISFNRFQIENHMKMRSNPRKISLSVNDLLLWPGREGRENL